MGRKIEVQEIPNVTVADEVPAGTVLVKIPFVSPDAEAYCQRRPELDLTPAEARTLTGIALALNIAGERLPDGRPISSGGAAIRWILGKAGL